LIGNFEESTPPTIQVEALIRLITQLSRKYHINPKETKTYHMADTKKPYLSDIKQDGIIGHVHVGKTQCP
jgi:hypothetical protein